MKLIILQLKALISEECKNLMLIHLHRMINEGVLLLDERYKEPLVIELDAARKDDGKRVDFCFVDETAAIEQIRLERDTLLKEKQTRQERTIKKVEQVLGFSLFDWQKEYILNGKEYGAEIKFARRAGKTLAQILKICLSEGEPLKAVLKPACLAKNEFLHYLGEDGSTEQRARFFVHELKGVYERLKAAGGIDLREIEF